MLMCECQSSPLRLCGGCFPSPPKKIRSNIAKLKLLKSYFSTWCTVEHLTQTDISDHPLPGHCKEMMLSLAKIWCPKYDRDSINRKWIPFLFSVFVCKGGWRHTHTDTRVSQAHAQKAVLGSSMNSRHVDHISATTWMDVLDVPLNAT